MTEESRLRWQCRRGMRELDDLLLRYLNDDYRAANSVDKAAFQSILALSDPELNGYLLNRQKPQSEPIARVIEHILSKSHT